MLLSEFLRKWGWFQGINERFRKYLSYKLKFQKTETQFCRWKSNDSNNINIFLSLKNSCTFLLMKEKTWKCIFNTNSKLSQNCTEKQIMLFKTTVNCLLNDMMLFSCWLFWLKNQCFSTNHCKGFIVSLTSWHIFSSGDFWYKSPSWFLKILKFQNFQKCTRVIYPKLPSQTCVTITNTSIHSSRNEVVMFII